MQHLVLCCAVHNQVLSIQQQEGRATSVTAGSSNSSSSSRSSGQPTAAGDLEQQQQQQYAADVVVVAAGVGSSELCLQLGYRLPLLHKPAAILLTHPVAAGTVRHMLVTDTVFVLQVSY
jgi:L-2-hydroxyglutarate oxidase LhgO